MINIILYGISLQCFLTYFCLKFKTRITPHNINNIIFFDLRHTSSRKDHLHSCQNLPQKKKERHERKQNKRPKGLDGHLRPYPLDGPVGESQICILSFIWSLNPNPLPQI